MSAKSSQEVAAREPSPRGGSAAGSEHKDRRVISALILDTRRRASLDHLSMALDLKRKIWSSLVTVITEEKRDPDDKEYTLLKEEIWRFAVARDHTRSDLVMLKEMLLQALVASKLRLKSLAAYLSLITLLNVVIALLVWYQKKVCLAEDHASPITPRPTMTPSFECESSSGGFLFLRVGLWTVSGLMGLHALYSLCGHSLLRSRIAQVAKVQTAIETSEISEATCSTMRGYSWYLLRLSNVFN